MKKKLYRFRLLDGSYVRYHERYDSFSSTLIESIAFTTSSRLQALMLFQGLSLFFNNGLSIECYEV